MPGSPQITSEGQKVTQKSKVSICCTGAADFLEIMWEDVEEQCAEQPVRKLEAGGKSQKRISDFKILSALSNSCISRRNVSKCISSGRSFGMK